MIAPLFLLITSIAALTLLLLLMGKLPNTMGSAISAVFWLALIPASFDVELVANDVTTTTVAEPIVTYLAVAGLGISVLYLFADVTGQLQEREPSGGWTGRARSD
jgi:hypothetical protein